MRVRPPPTTQREVTAPIFGRLLIIALAGLAGFAGLAIAASVISRDPPQQRIGERTRQVHAHVAEEGSAASAELPSIKEPRRESREGFPCTVIRVHDGDGPLWCSEGPRIRLSGIAARELDQTCLPGHPCPAASGNEARAMLESLALGKALWCRQLGMSYKRTVALCSTPEGRDLSCLMVRSGMALRWPKHDPEGLLVGC
jgi:endonuclease YncB( thermonuclease family)